MDSKRVKRIGNHLLLWLWRGVYVIFMAFILAGATFPLIFQGGDALRKSIELFFVVILLAVSFTYIDRSIEIILLENNETRRMR